MCVDPEVLEIDSVMGEVAEIGNPITSNLKYMSICAAKNGVCYMHYAFTWIHIDLYDYVDLHGSICNYNVSYGFIMICM